MAIKSLRRQILEAEGLVSARVSQRRRKIISTEIPSVYPKEAKTEAMVLLEVVNQKPIEVLLHSDPACRGSARRLLVMPSTVCKWRKKLGRYWSRDRLPSCSHCGFKCKGSLCKLLIEQERWDILPLKLFQE